MKKSKQKIETIKYFIVCAFLIFLSGCSHEEDQQVMSSMQERDPITQTGAMNRAATVSNIVNVNVVVNDGWDNSTNGYGTYYIDYITDAEINVAWKIFLKTTKSFDSKEKKKYKLNIMRDTNFSLLPSNLDPKSLETMIIDGVETYNKSWGKFFQFMADPSVNIVIRHGISPDATKLKEITFRYDGYNFKNKAGFGLAGIGKNHEHDLAQTISLILGAKSNTNIYPYLTFLQAYDIMGPATKTKFRLFEHKSSTNIATIRKTLDISY